MNSHNSAPIAPTKATPDSLTQTQKLELLDQLLQTRLITQETYNAKKAKVLKGESLVPIYPGRSD
jgi:hypothetical protein